MPDFLLPDLGEGLDEAEVVAWHVGVGDRVTIDQGVVEVETAKALVQVPIPFAGVVSALHAEAGTVVAVGSPLISVAAEEHERPGPAEPGVVIPEGAREPDVVTPARPVEDGDAGDGDAGSGNVLIGYGTSAEPRRARRGTRRPAPPAAPTPPAAPAPAAAPAPEGRRDRVAVISPLVRRLAREAGVDLVEISGTGPSGLVLRRDVDLAVARAREVPAPAPIPAAAPAEVLASTGGTRIPIRGLRRTVAEAMSRSRREIPEATVWVDVDATGMLAARAALNARDPERPVSVVALLARFAVLALRRFPELNARIEGEEIVVPDHVHLGFAAQTERGLLVPVVHDAHLLPTRDLSAALAQQTASARSGTLTPSDLTGGTITVNNYGVFGVDGSAAIINHPEVAILGMGRIIDRPWVVDGQLAVRRISQLTLAFDHRVCDGGTAGGFLRSVADFVESPVLALGDL